MKYLVRNYSFPLNVYSLLFSKEGGSPDCFHYGLFDRKQMSIKDAQANSMELLWKYLPPPCKILAVGVDIGTTLARLCREGYSAVGISPDPNHVCFSKNHFGSELPIICSKLEDFSENLGRWDALLFHDSAHNIDPINLFYSASRLLSANGNIVVLDEFALRPMENHKENLHNLEYFIRLAQRAGFALEIQIDLSAMATKNIDWIIDALNYHNDSIQSELNISKSALLELKGSKKSYQEKISSGIVGYFLLCFKRKNLPAYMVGRISTESSLEMRALFSDVFNQEMSESHWNWKYGEGRGVGIGVWRKVDNKLVAHYGGTSRSILLFGRPIMAFQACDLMVKVSERGSFSKKGCAFLAIATFLENECGYGAHHLLGIGFANERAYRLPKLLGLYIGSIGRIQEVIWPATNSNPSHFWKIREITLSSQQEKTLADTCWASMAADLKNRIVGIRNADYLFQRYIKHPDKQYKMFLVRSRFSNRLAGVIVIRVVSPYRCELLDTLGPLEKVPLLVQYAQFVAKQLGCNELFLWAVNNIICDFGHCPTIKDLNIIIPGNGWTMGPAYESIDGKWWITGGDADFH